jgi:group I intron endonuclease
MAISSGAYCITIGEKFYIGGTKDYNVRIKAHYGLLKNNKHGNSYMQNMFNKYGYIEAELIEECDISKIVETEQKYIDQWFDDERCMNFMKTAEIKHGHKHSEETKRKMSEAAKLRDPSTRGVYKRTKELNEKIRQANSIISWEDAAEIRRLFSEGVRQHAIGKMFGIDQSTVSNVITGKRWKVEN